MDEIPALLPSFRRHLRAARLAHRTIQSYDEAVDQLTRFLKDDGRSTEAQHVQRSDCEAFIADLIERHRPSTAANRFRGLQQFWKWAEDEGYAISVERLDRYGAPVRAVDESLRDG